jgi:hypothetical protein
MAITDVFLMNGLIRAGGRLTMKAVDEGGTAAVIYHATNNVDEIAASGRMVAGAEGSVYGMAVENAPWYRTGIIGQRSGEIVFEGEAAELFSPHEVDGWHSGLKRLVGQYKSAPGDIVIQNSLRVGNRLIVTVAYLAPTANPLWSLARLAARRAFLEPIFYYYRSVESIYEYHLGAREDM